MTLNLELTPHLEEKIKYLLSKQGGNPEYFFRDFIFYKISELEKAIFKAEIEAREFEKKYNLKSDNFYKQFTEGKFGDEDDFMIWSGLCEILEKNKAELEKLK